MRKIESLSFLSSKFSFMQIALYAFRATSTRVQYNFLTSMPIILEIIAGPRSPMMTKKATQVPNSSPMILISTASFPAGPNVWNAANTNDKGYVRLVAEFELFTETSSW